MKHAYCYILYNNQGLTYTGYTVDIKKRIRQHNGELCGGARYTHGKGPWKYLCHMTSSNLDKNLAMSLEWWLKHPTGHRKRPKEYQGIKGRLMSVLLVCGLPKFTHLPFDYYVDPLVHDLPIVKDIIQLSLSRKDLISEDITDIEEPG
jgi:putative endonuclease